jgi:ornithine cyclodeaminase
VSLWNWTRRRAIALAFGLSIKGVEVEIVDDLGAALAEADIVSCATLSATPLVRGAKLRKGAHVDLVGGFTPKMREADDDAIKRARLFVDTREGAFKEAGDIVEPLKRKLITKDDVKADLFDLCRGVAKGRGAKGEITLFKSVGSAIEDLAAARLVWSKIDK